jgi:hypothetical protein
VTVTNETERSTSGTLTMDVNCDDPSAGCEIVDAASLDATLPVGLSTHEFELIVPQYRLWCLDDPCLYRITARLGAHTTSVRCGFRDFRVIDGFFYLNGKRIFLRSSHTGNHYPIGQVVAPDPDMVRRDLLMAKASGFNCLRWISGCALPEQMDFCDEIGLMVYEEAYPAWYFHDAPKLRERYERSYNELILRDRNHPSITIWGLMNEMPDGPAFRCAVDYLPKLRDLDPTRLVLLHSGRWDKDPSIGSVSNPGSRTWEPQWGVEGPDPPSIDKREGWAIAGGYVDRAGDAHFYPAFPMTENSRQILRSLGTGSKPVFLSEAGIGSQINAIEDLRGFDRFDVPADLFDRSFLRKEVEQFAVDWKRFGMEEVYSFPVDFFRDSYARHSQQRRLLFDLIRSNPQICGYNLTGLLDHALTGEGLWSFWRRWKPGIVEVLEDGWSPLRWCLFVTPPHGYTGRPIEIEAVLANEGALRPGSYNVTFRIWSASVGIVWERRVVLVVRPDGPLAFQALKETLQLELPPGEYTFAADLERGGAPTGDRLAFHLTNSPARATGDAKIRTWGIDERVRDWLNEHGHVCQPYVPTADGRAERSPIVVGNVSSDPRGHEFWPAIKRETESGGHTLLLAPEPFHPAESSPWDGAFTARPCEDGLYHKECVGKRHTILSGLQTGGVLDWRYWGQMIAKMYLDTKETPREVIAAGFQACAKYEAGVLIGRQGLGDGEVLFNSFPVLDHVGAHPVADRLLLNLIGATIPLS